MWRVRVFVIRLSKQSQYILSLFLLSKFLKIRPQTRDTANLPVWQSFIKSRWPYRLDLESNIIFWLYLASKLKAFLFCLNSNRVCSGTCNVYMTSGESSRPFCVPYRYLENLLLCNHLNRLNIASTALKEQNSLRWWIFPETKSRLQWDLWSVASVVDGNLTDAVTWHKVSAK